MKTFFVKVFLPFSILFFGIIFIVSNGNLKPIFQINRIDILQLFVIFFGYFFTQVVLLKYAVRFYGLQLGIIECFKLFFVTLFANYFLPAAGIALRGQYLKRQFGFEWSCFLASLIAITLIELFVFCLCGLLISFQMDYSNHFLFWIQIIFGGISMAALLATIVPKIKLELKNPFLYKILKIFREAGQAVWSASFFFPVFFWTLVQLCLFAFAYFEVAHALKLTLAFPHSVLLASLADISFIFRVTPGGIGGYEGVLLFSTSLTGLRIEQTLNLIILSRGVMLFIILIFGPLCSYALYRKMNLRIKN